MSALTFTPGKFYKTRDGKKARIYATDGSDSFPIHGALYICGEWRADVWTASGGELIAEPSDRDLIAEWKDAPEVDWSVIPPEIQFVALCYSGEAYGYRAKPRLGGLYFVSTDCWAVKLYPSHTPKWSGDWRDSLVTRPTEGAQP